MVPFRAHRPIHSDGSMEYTNGHVDDVLWGLDTEGHDAQDRREQDVRGARCADRDGFHSRIRDSRPLWRSDISVEVLLPLLE